MSGTTCGTTIKGCALFCPGVIMKIGIMCHLVVHKKGVMLWLGGPFPPFTFLQTWVLWKGKKSLLKILHSLGIKPLLKLIDFDFSFCCKGQKHATFLCRKFEEIPRKIDPMGHGRLGGRECPKVNLLPQALCQLLSEIAHCSFL